MRARTRGVACVLALVTALLPVALTVVVLSPGAPVDAQDAASGSLPSGTLVLALPALGQVNAIPTDGVTEVLARGLSGPSAVAVLGDGTVLVAEQSANRVSAFAGSFGPQPQAVAEVPGPTGLVVAPDGMVFVTGAGQVGRLDVAARRYQVLAQGLVSPLGPAVRGTTLYVPDPGAGRIATFDTTTGAAGGDVVAPPAPGGAAAAAGLPVFVAETQGPGVARIDPSSGALTPFATVPGAQQLAFVPANPSPDADWTLAVVTQTGLTRLSAEGRVVGDRLALAGIAGISSVPQPSVEAATPPPTDDGSGSAWPWIVGVALVGLVVLGLLFWWAARRRRPEREDGGAMTSSAAHPAPPSRGCDEQAAAVERTQELLRHVTAQLEDAQALRRRAAEAASDARDRAMRALEVRTSLRNQRAAAEPPPPGAGLSAAQLAFRTGAGREALEAFRRHELDAGGLKQRLAELGEADVIDQIADEGRRLRRADPAVPWPEEHAAVRDAVAARDQLRIHQQDAADAGGEVARLGARQQELTGELAEARQRLDDCRRSGR